MHELQVQHTLNFSKRNDFELRTYFCFIHVFGSKNPVVLLVAMFNGYGSVFISFCFVFRFISSKPISMPYCF